jgi:hypothetical protein
MDALPHPFAYAQKDEFFALPLEERPPHIWECLQYLEWRRGEGDLPEADIDAQVAIMRHIAQDVAKHLARKLGAEGAWRDQYDTRWPRYHPNSKDPLYLTGCHPPLLLCLANDAEQWAGAASDASMHEMADWLDSPAGLHGITEEDRERTKQDAERYREADAKCRETEAELALSRERLIRSMEHMNRLRAKAGHLPSTPPKKRLLD